MNVYFDNAASAMVRPEAIDAMMTSMRDCCGNPSAFHEQGRRAALQLSDARTVIANALKVTPESIILTSGGTESNNLALFGTVKQIKRKGRHIITSAIEHSAVLSPIKRLEEQGFEVTYLSPDTDGRIPAASLTEALREDTVLVSIMLVNNETGAVNPVSEYADAVKNCGRDIILHTDAVQGFMKLPFSAKTLGADMISVSSHKLHGPKGAGALYVADKIKLTPLIIGGEQEKGRRAGTEALPAIAGFAKAVQLGSGELMQNLEHVRDLRKYTTDLLSAEVPDCVIIGQGDCPYILSLSLPGFKSEVLMNFLSAAGICVSKGAACKKGARSHTLTAMKLPDAVTDGALRISFSRYSTKQEASYFAGKLKEASETLIH